MTAPSVDIAVVEDVWDDSFESLSRTYAVLHEPQAWRDRRRLGELVRTTRVLVVRNRTRVDAELLAEADERLGLICRAGAGLDNIDVDAASSRGIDVLAAPGANARSVAELAMTLALDLARRVSCLDRGVRAGRWDRREGLELAGRTWGVIGLGATGVATARLAAAVGLNVLAHDPYVVAGDSRASPAGARLCNLDELLALSHVVSLHVPLTDATRGLVDAQFLGVMRSDAFLLNVSRGALVDETALADALDAGKLGGAGLDVRVTEPPSVGRLERTDRVVLTPHVGGLTVEAQQRIAEHLTEGIRRFLDQRKAEG